MRYRKISLTAFITLLLTISLPVAVNSALFPASQVLAQTPADRKAQADTLFEQGIEQYQTSQFEAALQSWQQALIIYREIRDRKREGNTLGNLGLVYYSLGDYVKAIEYHSSSLDIAREIPNRKGEGQALGNLGSVYYSLGDYVKAIEYQQQSLVIARETKNSLGEAQSLNNLGNAYYSLGDYAKAIENHSSSLDIYREIKDRLGEAQAVGNLGSDYEAQGDYANAIKYQQQGLDLTRKLDDPLGEAQSLSNLGLAYFYLGDYAKAIEYHSSSLAIARKIQDIDGQGASLNNLGLAFYKSGNLPEAEKILYTAIELWESLRGKLGKNDAYKISIFEQQARTYRTLQQVLIAQNKTKEALEISERGRSRAFVELLNSRLSSKNAGQSQETPVEKPTLSLLQQIAKQHSSTLVEYSIIYDDFKTQGQQESKESELYIWVIKPTGEVTFRKADLKALWQKENTTLAKLVTTSRKSIGIQERGGVNVEPTVDKPTQTKRLQQLHEILIKPIANLLPTDPNARVVFVPQTSLFLVPFPALQDANGKYLIEKHTILTAPSIQVLDLTHRQRERGRGGERERGGILIVGNPTMPKVSPSPGKPAQQLPPLRWAEKEAKDIAALFKTQALTGNQATKTAIAQKMSQARIVHFATHGILDNYRGLGSAIALAPDFSAKDDTGNGLLTAEEILNMKLNADLVVLSACNTGRGRVTGDGVIGLSRSLISAGVPSVIVSLWSVDDNSTSFLMTEFYKDRQQKLDKATALRNAMLTTKKKYPDPLHWSAFTLIGEAD